MELSRRAVLRIGGRALASAATMSLAGRALAAPAVIGVKELNARTLSLDGYNTGEKLARVRPIRLKIVWMCNLGERNSQQFVARIAEDGAQAIVH